MTEKRFKKLVSSIDYYDLWDTVEDKGYVAEDLANALYEENEQLKKQREELFIRERDTKNDWRELKQENEQLKKVLLNVVNRLYNSENSMIWERSSDISQDELELEEEFKKEFGKYGWKND